MPKPEWDIELFRQQAQAGMQGWYVHFLADDATVGLLGPFGREDIAESIKKFYVQIEEVACERIIDNGPLPVSYFVRFESCQVVPLTPHEFECLSYGVE